MTKEEQMTDKQSIIITFRGTKDFAKKLDQEAKKRGISRAALIKVAIYSYLEGEDKRKPHD